jgi:hypothetical protein
MYLQLGFWARGAWGRPHLEVNRKAASGALVVQGL